MANIIYTIDTYAGPVPQTSINGVSCPFRQDVVEYLIGSLSNLNSESNFLDIGSKDASVSYLGVLYGNSAAVYSHYTWPTSGWEDGGYPVDGSIAEYWNFWNTVKQTGNQRKIIPMRGIPQYTLGCHDEKTIDLAFVSVNLLGDIFVQDILKILTSRMKSGGQIILVEAVTSSPAFDKILQTVPNSQQITSTVATATQLARQIRFMSILC